jgi:type 1 glutamine amidotransferase
MGNRTDMRLFLPLLAGAFSILFAQQAPQPRKIQVLIVTGQDKHPWRESTPYLRGLLEQTGKFEVRVTEEFHGTSPETLAPYDALVLNYSDEKLTVPPWSEATKQALLSFVRSGKGLVVYHHAAASFQDWPEYRALLGCVWRTGQSHHAPVHDYKVDIQDPDHPITRGLTSLMAETDELYAGLECEPSDKFHVLATGWDDHSLYRVKQGEKPPSGPSRNEPLLWTLNYGSGRVFATMLGNDMRAVHTPGFISTFVRGAEWAATGKVTIPPPVSSPRSTPAGWLSFGGDSQRTGWARGETLLKKENVGNLELKWKAQLDNSPKELTSLAAPVVVDQVKTDRGIKEYVIVAGSSDDIFAIDADTGKTVWQKKFSAEGAPSRRTSTLCPFALNATPAIQAGRPQTVYVISSDGKLHALSAVDGEDRSAPRQFVPPFSKNWSLNIAENVLYTAVSQGCNGVMSGVYSVDISQPDQPIRDFQAGRPGIWGRAGVAISPVSGTVFAETGDGVFDPNAGSWGDTFLALSPRDLRVTDYYTPANREWLTRKDLDMGCMTPVVFEFNGKEYLVGGGKEGRLFLLDTSSLGGTSHREPLLRTDLLTNADAAYAGHGFWGSFGTWMDATKTRWLFAPAWGPPHPDAISSFPITNGDATAGSIMAFRIEGNNGSPALKPSWISRGLNVPEPPIVANGVVFALSSGEDVRQADAVGKGLNTVERVHGSGHAVLYALDAETGKQLFSSGGAISSFTHFGGIAVSNGRVFVTAWDGTVYAFGIKNEQR